MRPHRFFTSDAGILRALQRRMRAYRPAEQELADAELRWMFEHAQTTKKTSYIGSPSTSASTLSREQRRGLVDMVRQVTREHKPLAYVLGTQPFGALELLVRPPVLIPRPETEQWATRIAEMVCIALPEPNPSDGEKRKSGDVWPSSLQPFRILDFCSGSGCISLLIAHTLRHKFPPPLAHWSLTACDINPTALALSRENAARCNIPLGSSPGALDVRHLDLFDEEAVRSLIEKERGFDMIVCNPPYITPRAWEKLEPSVKDWEDHKALVGAHKLSAREHDADGLAFYHRIAALLDGSGLLSARNLKSHAAEDASSTYSSAPALLPAVVLEVGEDQAEAVRSIVSRASQIGRTGIWEDAWGVPRVVLGWRKSG